VEVALCHTAHTDQECFEEHDEELRFRSGLENLWDVLDQQV